ncbi:hypothetical protein GCK32_001840 [Trichostrongylus colubriformis]|uniref:Uncharacterized protein n=1 Tax=Trichostrongylus colubriformis TaxID=6319 RepID=A0AAN8IN47_TRICO
MKDPVHDFLGDYAHDPSSVWSSYRSAALRSGQKVNFRSQAPLVSQADHGEHQEAACSLAMERLRAEITKLRRLIHKKDLVIDILIEKIVKSRKMHGSRSDSQSSVYNLSSPTSPDTSDGGNKRRSSGSSQSIDVTELRRTTASPVLTNKAMSTIVVCKDLKYIHSKKNQSSPAAQYPVSSDNGMEYASGSNETFIVQSHPNEFHICERGEDGKNRRNAVNLKNLKESDNTNSIVPRRDINRSVFVIEGLSSRSEDNHPDWKTPTHPSVLFFMHNDTSTFFFLSLWQLCLMSNRPELIRRIENRQAAISAAAALRHRVAEEKKFAARGLVQGKCSFGNVKNILFLDPTLITAFPKDEVINLTKRHLRASNAYKSECSEGRSRVNIAASRVIAQSFSEATRQAVLSRRPSSKFKLHS